MHCLSAFQILTIRIFAVQILIENSVKKVGGGRIKKKEGEIWSMKAHYEFSEDPIKTVIGFADTINP